MTDLLSKLPLMSWRGLELPVADRSVTFAHDNVEHKFQYRDGEIIERTGARNWTFSYTIPFREDLIRGPYKNLFSQKLSEFVLSCRDRAPGELNDPVLGQFRAVCTSYSEESDVNKRDGVDVRVEFVHAPEIGDIELLQGGVLGLSGVNDTAKKIDEDIRVINWKQKESPQPSADPLSQISGFGRQIERQGNKISARLDDVAMRAEAIEKAADRLEDPNTFQIKRSSRRVQTAALRLKDRITNPEKRIMRVTTAYARSLTEIAASSGMTLKELLDLNPTLAQRPMVPANTVVSVFKRG